MRSRRIRPGPSALSSRRSPTASPAPSKGTVGMVILVPRGDPGSAELRGPPRGVIDDMGEEGFEPTQHWGTRFTAEPGSPTPALPRNGAAEFRPRRFGRV